MWGLAEVVGFSFALSLCLTTSGIFFINFYSLGASSRLELLLFVPWNS